MKAHFNCPDCRLLCAGLAALALVSVGCSKEEAPPPAAAVPVEAPAPAPEAAPAQVYIPPEPAADDSQAQLQQVDARMQNLDYEGAVDVMLRAQIAAQQQQANQSAQQRVDYHNRMRMLQKQVADAMASGDPNAQRAARLLMQYNAAQTGR